MPLIERRYAEALINISVEDGAIDVYQQELGAVAGIFDTQPDFRFFLLNPRIKTDMKKETLKQLFGGTLKAKLVSFLLLLVDKGRIKFLPGIMEEFAKLADRKKNTLNMTVISAAPLQEAQLNQIKEKYRKLYGASAVKAEAEIDPSLIGGIKVRIGDRVIDGSIKGRLESLRDLIVEKN